MPKNLSMYCFVFSLILFANQLNAKEKIKAYFLNDSVNGITISDAYETHNMGLVYSTDKYYLGLDLGIVSPDMLVYRNKYREANRSFGELISLEIGQPRSTNGDLRFYARIKAVGEFGIDKIQDFAHQILSLQQVNEVNELIRMPADAWAGIGLRSEFEPNFFDSPNITLKFDGYFGLDTTFLHAKIKKEIYYPFFTYDMSVGGRFVAYDHVVSAPPINAKERRFIPQVAFGVSYDFGPYNIFVKDSFSLPSVEVDNDLYGVLSAGLTYEF